MRLYPDEVARVLGLYDFLPPDSHEMNFSTFEIETAYSLELAKEDKEDEKALLHAAKHLIDSMANFASLLKKIRPLSDLSSTQELFLQMEEWMKIRGALFEKGTPFYLCIPILEGSRVMGRSRETSEEFKEMFGSKKEVQEALALFMEDPSYQCHYRFDLFEDSAKKIIKLDSLGQWEEFVEELPPNHSPRTILPWDFLSLSSACPMSLSDLSDDEFTFAHWLGSAFVDPRQRRPNPWFLTIEPRTVKPLKDLLYKCFYQGEAQAKECWVAPLESKSLTTVLLPKLTGFSLSWRISGLDQRVAQSMRSLEARPTNITLPPISPSVLSTYLSVFFSFEDHPFTRLTPFTLPRNHLTIKTVIDLWFEIVLTSFRVVIGGPMDVLFKDEIDKVLVEWCVKHGLSFGSLTQPKSPMEFLSPVTLLVSSQARLLPDKERGYFIVGLSPST